jgi:hypothetical protein
MRLDYAAWGQYARIAAKTAAYNMVCTLIAHAIARMGALATLLCKFVDKP